jgi:glycosyltransferase involved in cell wall biosynthesis
MNTEKTSKTVELSVIVPMYNEGQAVTQNVNRFAEVLKALDLDWELIPVNDGSTDDTKQQLEKIRAENDRVRPAGYDRNRGRGYALRTGINASRGRYVVTTEADLSYGEAIIGRLYRELKKGQADIVIASPYMPGGKLDNVPFARALLSRGANWLLKRAVTPKISTVSGMTRGYRGDAIRAIPLEEDGKEIHLEIVSKGSVLGYRFDEIPATLAWRFSEERIRKASKLGLKTVKHIISHLLFGFSEAPFMLFGTIGLLLLAAGLVTGQFSVCRAIFTDRTIADSVGVNLACLIFLLAGVFSFLLYFLAYQNRDTKREILKVRQALHLLKQDTEKTSGTED